MLTFFRKIRKGHLGSGQARKYLLYAIGEILLVMIGILLALQVNNWNEERKKIDQGKDHLQQIFHDLKSDVQNLSEVIRLLEVQGEASIETLDLVHKEGKSEDDLLTIHDNVLLKGIAYSVPVKRSENTWDALKSSGSLKYVGNDSLTFILSEFYDYYDSRIEHFLQIPYKSRENLRSYIVATNTAGDLRDFLQRKEWRIRTSSSIQRVKKWLASKTFKETLTQVGSSSVVQQIQFTRLKTEAHSIISYMEENYGEILKEE